MRTTLWIASGLELLAAAALGLGSVADAANHPGTIPTQALRTSNVVETQSITLRSRILGEERMLLIHMPRDYDDRSRRYPVLIVLDADWHFNIAAAHAEFLSECSYTQPNPVPPLIVVGVVNVDRNRDFTPTRCPTQGGMSFPSSGGADMFRRFLVEEVMPLIDERYRTVPFRILAGWSLGGLFSVTTLLSNGPFDSYLAISPSLWWDDALVQRRLEAGELNADPGHPRKLVVTLGTTEVSRNSSVARSVEKFMAYLKSNPLQGASVEEVEIEGLGHNDSPAIAYLHGLAAVFADLTPPAETLGRGLAAVDAYYAGLTERYRFEIPVPEDVYSTLGWRLLGEHRREESYEVFRRWVDRHPGSSVALASLGAFCRETGDREKAVALLRQAIALEERSAQPRETFLHDLKRDIAALLPSE